MERKNICAIVFICVIIGMIILTLSLWASSERIPLTSGCAIFMEYLPPHKQQPLLLRQNNELDYLNAFVLPNNDGLLSFKTGDKINVACPGENNHIVLNGAKTTSQFEEAQCEEELNFKIIGKSIRIYNITCFSAPKHVARKKESCGANKEYEEILIGFEVSGRFIKHLVVCYDRKLQRSLYSHQILSSVISGGQKDSSDFNDFFEGDFYDVQPNVTELYTKKTQRKTVNAILGIPDKDENFYIKDDNRAFLSKGHYSAKADFLYGSQQYLTYYYVNMAPQWYSFNSGNWNNMEIKCREFAKDKKLDLDIYTGSHGISKLPDYDSTSFKELFLWTDAKNDSIKGIPVPQLYYRVVYDQKSQAGVAFVGVNNPYMFFSKEDVICKDVCDQVKWIGTDANRTNVDLGYFYCCEIDDFRKTVKTIPPEFVVKSLLN